MGKALNNTIYYTIGAVIKAMASFLLLPIFTNMLGAAQYGVLNLLQTFSTIMATIMTLAVERSLYRLFYDYHTEEEQSRFLSTVFWLICMNSIVVIGLTVLFGQYIAPYLGDVDVYTILLPVVIYTFLSATINFFLIVMQVEQNGRQFFIVSLLILIIYNIIALLLMFFYTPTVQSLVYASFATFIIVTPIAFCRIRKRIRFTIDRQCVYAVFRYSSPMLMMIVFAWVLNFSDRLFIANMSNYENVGIYSLAAKIVSVMTLIAGAIFQAYGPYFYNIANTMPEREAKSKLKETNSAITLIICLLGISIVVFSKTVLHLFFSQEFESSLIFVYLLTVSAVFTQQSGLLNVMIYQNKKTFAISMITIVSGILSVLLNYYCIPVFGAIFAGISNLIVGLFLITLTFFLARRNYYIEINIPLLIYSVILILVCAFCDYGLEEQWPLFMLKAIFLGCWLIGIVHMKIVSVPMMAKVWNSICRKIPKQSLFCKHFKEPL